jgi:hypothetical protein
VLGLGEVVAVTGGTKRLLQVRGDKSEHSQLPGHGFISSFISCEKIGCGQVRI